MAQVPLILKQKVEHLFGMASGYVLDFSNATFADFVLSSIAMDPYEGRAGSKATVLRQIWTEVPDESFARLTLDMLERRRLARLLQVRGAAEPDPDEALAREVEVELRQILQRTEHIAAEQEVAFLAHDFSDVDLDRVPVPIGYGDVIKARLQEIEICAEHGAPLAVVVLCGSTLEGLLLQLAVTHSARFVASKAAPVKDGKVRPITEWSLQHLIQVARDLGILGEDVAKYAHSVREFRNYIHPHQQVQENFKPREATGRIARQVLLAAMADLVALNPLDGR